MTQIYLEKQAFAVANELRKEGYDIGELVSTLLIAYYQNPEKQIPEEKCAFCSHRYYSKDNLHAHISRVHSEKVVVKNEVGK